MKTIGVANANFRLRAFLLRVMRGIRPGGHDVIGACGAGPSLALPRSEGFRIVAIPFERRLSPLAHWHAFRALVRLFREERPDLVHAHMPISGLLARMAGWRAGVPPIACNCRGFWFNYPGMPDTRD